MQICQLARSQIYIADWIRRSCLCPNFRAFCKSYIPFQTIDRFQVSAVVILYSALKSDDVSLLTYLTYLISYILDYIKMLMTLVRAPAVLSEFPVCRTPRFSIPLCEIENSHSCCGVSLRGQHHPQIIRWCSVWVPCQESLNI